MLIISLGERRYRIFHCYWHVLPRKQHLLVVLRTTFATTTHRAEAQTTYARQSTSPSSNLDSPWPTAEASSWESAITGTVSLAPGSSLHLSTSVHNKEVLATFFLFFFAVFLSAMPVVLRPKPAAVGKNRDRAIRSEVDLLHRVSRANRRRRILHTSFAFPSGPENDGGGSKAGHPGTVHSLY